MSNFFERLLLRSSESRRVSEIKPAITPDALPETFALPAEKFTPSHLIPSDASKNTETAAVQAQEAEPIPEDRESEVTRTVFSPPIDLDKVGSERKAVISSKTDLKSTYQSSAIDADGSGVSKTKVSVRESPPVHAGAQSEDKRQKRAEQSSTDKTAPDLMTRAESPPIKSMFPQAKPVGTGTAETGRAESPPIKSMFPQAKPVGTGTAEGAFSISQKKQQSLTQAMQQTKPEARRSDPNVTVSIGRIEVRALMPEKPLPKEAVPKLSLQEYLKRRLEGTI
jgi:hypothetical protein